MIPFVNSIRKEKGILAIDYKETKYGRYQSFSPLSEQLQNKLRKFSSVLLG